MRRDDIQRQLRTSRWDTHARHHQWDVADIMRILDDAIWNDTHTKRPPAHPTRTVLIAAAISVVFAAGWATHARLHHPTDPPKPVRR